MEIPRVSRPYMPGYGIAGPDEGSGLLHWSWAAERLTATKAAMTRTRLRKWYAFNLVSWRLKIRVRLRCPALASMPGS